MGAQYSMAQLLMQASRVLLLCAILSACASPPPSICTPTRDDSGRIARSRAAIAEFKRLHPCPVTGLSTGACAGYVVDHIDPLCHCGADAPANMQWQTVEDAKVKDQWERKLCGI